MKDGKTEYFKRKKLLNNNAKRKKRDRRTAFASRKTRREFVQDSFTFKWYRGSIASRFKDFSFR